MSGMKIGILGAGRIADTMAETILGMQKAGIQAAELYGVASRDRERAEHFAAKHGIPRAFGSYEEMLEDPDLELVYLATPHSHHGEQARMCVLHGKAVLCEKAFTANAAQAREVLALAEEKGVLVTEAIWTRYQPMRQTILETVNSGIVGKPVTLTANLCYPIMDKARIMAPELAGGALLDVGVYTLNFAEMVFGRADEATAVGILTDTGVDEAEAIYLRWKDGRTAVLNAGIRARSDRKGFIYCTDGFIEIENINNPQMIRVYDGEYRLLQEQHCPAQITGYEYEVLEAVEAVRAGKTECASMPHGETIHMMERMDSLRKQLGVVYPFER